MNRILIVIIMVFTSYSTLADDCTYSIDGIERPKYTQEELSFSEWKNSDFFVGILTSGEYVSVKYWACNHFGMNAELFSPLSEGGLSKEAVLAFTSKVLSGRSTKR